jgi:tetratricopeptide (TPR) repeat protein
VIPPAEAALNQVRTPNQGRLVLGATHVLDTRMRPLGDEMAVTATLLDVQSGRTVREQSGAYPSGDPQMMTKAVVAMVTEFFRLPAVDRAEEVSGRAGAAYAEGMALVREAGTNGSKAIACFAKAIELNPWSALPYAGLAEAQLLVFEREGGKWLDLASANVAKAKSLNADSPPVLLVSGILAQHRGRYEEAIRDFARVTEREPANSEAWRHLAISYERTSRPDDVVITYERAIEAQPGYYRHYLSFGNFYLNGGQFDRAETLYRKVVSVAPGHAAGHINLGLALMQQGRFRDAEASLLTASRIHASAELLVNIGALYYAQERFEEALTFFERSLHSGPPTIIRYANLGDAYRHLGRTEKAVIAYQKAMDMAEEAIARNPRDASSRVFLGLMAAQLRDRRRAEAELAQSLALEPENATVIREAAIGYEALGQRARTLAVLSRASSRVLDELSRQPDVKDLQQDGRFRQLLAVGRTP